MSKIKLTGDSSGYVEISAGNAAGNNTLEAPTSGTRLVAHEGTQDVVLGGNLTVNGVLTYEDVTNIDAVGVITARSGIHVTGGSIGIGTDNPDTKLHVFNSPTTGQFKIGGGNGPNNHRVYINSHPTESYIDSYGNNAYAKLRINAAPLLLNESGGGNVGIRTDNPNNRQLSIYGPGINGTQIECRATGGNSSGLSMYAGRNFEIQSTSSTEVNYPNSFLVYDRDANGYRMAIDGSGRVLMPAQPSFFSRPPGGYNLSSGANTIGGTWSDIHNIGSHFSNGTFTVPVAGTYQFDWACFVQSETSRLDAYILVNGTNVMREEISGYPTTANKSSSVHGCYYLAVNDVVTFGLHSQAGTQLYTSAAPWSYASGFLVG